MLKNKKTVYFCQECGYESSKWMGQCPGCKAWNSFAEEPVSTGKKASGGGKSVSRQQSEPVILKEISLKEDERQTTKIGELDRVLGGGIVPGSFSCFAFVSFSPSWKAAQIPPVSPGWGTRSATR